MNRTLQTLALAAVAVTACGLTAPALADDPVVVQKATAFLPPDHPLPPAATGLGEGLALGVSAGAGSYLGLPSIDFTRYGGGLTKYGQVRVGWYVHRASSLDLTCAYQTTDSDRGLLTMWKPGLAYRYHPTSLLWAQAEIDFMHANYSSKDPLQMGEAGVANGFALEIGAGVDLWTTPSFVVQGVVMGGVENFWSKDGTFGVPFTLNLAVDYL
jgi:hypothetical protein